MPSVVTLTSSLQTRLLMYLSDITEDIVRAEGGEKYRDLTKFIKFEMISFLAQLFRILGVSCCDILKEEDFVKIIYDQVRVIKP